MILKRRYIIKTLDDDATNRSATATASGRVTTAYAWGIERVTTAPA